jgi:predicted DNA-binding transcriptional regulator AlpA
MPSQTTKEAHMLPIIVRRGMLKDQVGISPSSVDRLEASGDFPKRKKFSAGIVGWYGPEVEEWVRQKSLGVAWVSEHAIEGGQK